MIYNLFTLFFTFLKIGLFTIGGGYAMLPFIVDEVTQTHQWCSMDEIVDYVAVAESTPGPFSINLSTFVGMRVEGVLGVIAAVTGLVLPSFVIILVIVKYLHKFIEYKYVKAALYTLRPTTIGLMYSAAISFAVLSFNLNFDKTFFENLNYIELAIFAIIFALTKKFKLNAYLIISLSALFGILFYCVKRIFL